MKRHFWAGTSSKVLQKSLKNYEAFSTPQVTAGIYSLIKKHPRWVTEVFDSELYRQHLAKRASSASS